MKKILVMAFALAMALVSCEKLENKAPETDNSWAFMPAEDGTVKIRISAGPGNTKATNIYGDNRDEKRINKMQVLVFKDNLVVGYGSAFSGTLTINTTAGQREIWVVTNTETNLSGITSKTAFLATLADLQDSNFPSDLMMIGSLSTTITSGVDITVPVKRFASRIHLQSVTRSFAPTNPLASQQFIITKYYIVNAAGTINYGLDAVPQKWYNEGEDKDECSGVLDEPSYQTVANNAVINKNCYFYTFPNDPDVSGKTTYLVVEATLGGATYYYPVALPKLESNQSYEISKLTIKNAGSDDPEDPVKFEDFSFSVDVVDWTDTDKTFELES